MRHVKLFEEYTGDIYDEMTKKFPVTDKFMKELIAKLAEKGIEPIKVEEPDFDTDGSIEITDKVHLQITLDDNEIYGIVETPEGSFAYTNGSEDIDKILAGIEELKKKYHIK